MGSSASATALTAAPVVVGSAAITLAASIASIVQGFTAVAPWVGIDPPAAPTA